MKTLTFCIGTSAAPTGHKTGGVAYVGWNPRDHVHPVADRRTGDLHRLWWRRLLLLRFRNPPGTALPARTLSWEPPTSYVDATPMNPVTDLDQFEIYVNETGTFTDKDVPTASLSAVDPQTRTVSYLLQPGQPQPSRDRGTEILRFPARRRPHGTEVRFLPPGLLFLLIAPFRPVA